MPRPRSVRGTLKDLRSKDWTVVRERLEHLAGWLQKDPNDLDLVDEVGQRLVELAHHPKWEVRREVALTLEYLKSHRFQIAIAPLLVDSHETVRTAAKRSQARWIESSHSDVLSVQHAQLLREWLGDMEAHHGVHSREAGMRLAERYGALLMREAYHEITRFTDSIETIFKLILADMAQPELDRQVLSDRLRAAAERVKILKSAVEDLRRFTTPTTPARGYELLHPIVASALAPFQEKGGVGTPFVAEVDVDPNLQVLANRDRLLQAFSNLIVNAVESYDGMPGPRRLIVVGREEGGRAVLTFTDHGCGMSEELRRQVFRLLTTSKATGFGFGLPLATKIIKNEHQGAIDLESKKGKGTKVTVVLPLAQESGPK